MNVKMDRQYMNGRVRKKIDAFCQNMVINISVTYENVGLWDRKIICLFLLY
jgi:hypothetical protein